MALTQVARYSRALAEQLNSIYRVLKGTDPDSIDLRLNGGGHFRVNHSGTNAALFQVTDSGVTGAITPSDGTVTNPKLATGAVDSRTILDDTILNADVNGAANIAVAKLAHVGANNVLKSNGTQNVGGQVVNADVSGGAGIAYSKLALGGSIVNGDVSATAAIVPSKLANVTANQILKDVGSGVVGGGLLVDANVAAAGIANIALGKLAPGSAGLLKSNGSAISAGNQVLSSDMNAGGAGNMVLRTSDGVTATWSKVVSNDITGGAPPPNGSGAADAYKVYATGSSGTTVSLQQVATEMLAAGAVTQMTAVSQLASAATNSTSPVTLVDATITPTGGQVLAIVTGYCSQALANQAVYFGLKIDAAAVVSVGGGTSLAAGFPESMAVIYPCGVLSAGSLHHVILQWWVSNVSATATVAVGQYFLLELKK